MYTGSSWDLLVSVIFGFVLRGSNKDPTPHGVGSVKVKGNDQQTGLLEGPNIRVPMKLGIRGVDTHTVSMSTGLFLLSTTTLKDI